MTERKSALIMGSGMYFTTVLRGQGGRWMGHSRERRFGELVCMDDLTHPTRCSTMTKLTTSEGEEVDLTAVRTSTTLALVGPA